MYMWLLSRICIALIYVPWLHMRRKNEKGRREGTRGGGSGPGKGRGEGRRRGGGGSRVASLSWSCSHFFLWTPDWSGTRPVLRASGPCTAPWQTGRWQNKKQRTDQRRTWTVLRLCREVYGVYLLIEDRGSEAEEKVLSEYRNFATNRNRCCMLTTDIL